MNVLHWVPMNGGSATWRANSRYRPPPCAVGLHVVGCTVAGRQNMVIISCGRMTKNCNGSLGYATTAGRTRGHHGHPCSRSRSAVRPTTLHKLTTDPRALDDRGENKTGDLDRPPAGWHRKRQVTRCDKKGIQSMRSNAPRNISRPCCKSLVSTFQRLTILKNSSNVCFPSFLSLRRIGSPPDN